MGQLDRLPGSLRVTLLRNVRSNGVEPVDRPKDNQARSVLLTSISECHYGEIQEAA